MGMKSGLGFRSYRAYVGFRVQGFGGIGSTTQR